MNLREKKRDDSKLHNGDYIPGLRKQGATHTWSTKKLYEVKILQTRLVGEIEEVKVTYPGWSKAFDEWRQVTDIVETPAEAVNGSSEEFFKFSLLTSIKEKIRSCRKEDSEVPFAIPVQKQSFDEFVAAEQLFSFETKGKTIFHFSNKVVAKSAFSKGWWFRILNKAGDFSFIDLDTFQLRLQERPCLEEYSLDGKILYHRGFQAVVRFVINQGNREEHHLIT